MTAQQWYRWRGTSLEVRIHAKTGCRNEGPDGNAGQALRVRVSAPPVEGRANERLRVVLAEAFGVAKSRVQLIRGSRSPYKWYRIEQPKKLPGPLQYR